MSQKQQGLLHSQQFKKIELLDTPYPIIQVLIQYLSLLTSQKLWCKIIKSLSLLHLYRCDDFLANCIEREEESFQSQEQKINGIWTAMGVVSLLIITWIRLGKISSNPTLKNKPNLQLYLQVGKSKQTSDCIIMVQIYGTKVISKQQYCRYIHFFIINQCKKYGFIFQHQNTDKVQLKLSSALFYRRLQLPSILSISIEKQKIKNTLIMPRSVDRKTNYLNIRQYSDFLIQLSRLSNCSYQYNIRLFAEIFCTKINTKLQENYKNSFYYFTLSPLTILVKQEQTGDINFQTEIETVRMFYFEEKKIPVNLELHIYIDKEGVVSRAIERVDFWSAGLSLLSIISHHSVADFQELLRQLAGRQEIRLRFAPRQIQKLCQEEQFNSEVIINTLKKWLKVNQPQLKQTSNPVKVTPYFSQKKPVEKKQADSLQALDWLQNVMGQNTTEQTQSTTTSEKPPDKKNLEFIRSVNINSINNYNNYNNGNNSKNYTVYSTSSSSTNSKEVPNSQWSNKQKNNNIVGSDIKLQFLTKKNNSTNTAWEKCLEKLNNYNIAYNRIKQKLKVTPYNLLKQQQRPFNLFATKKQPEEIQEYGNSLLENKEIFEQLGYKCYQESHIIQINDICSVCLQKKQQYKNSPCNHSRCKQCYLKYFQQICESKPNPFQFIKCPYQTCSTIISYDLLKLLLNCTNTLNKKNFTNYMIENQIKSKRDNMRRCNNKNCKQNSPLFQINPNNRLFLCQFCMNYRCTNCCQEYHGMIDCIQYQNSKKDILHNQIKMKLKNFYEVKKPKDKINAVGYGKLMRSLMLQHPKIFEIMEASLLACVTFTWSIKLKQLNIVLSLSDHLTVTEQVITKLTDLLALFYKSLSEIGSKTDEQLKTMAEQLKPTISQILQLYQLRQTIIYVASIS